MSYPFVYTEAETMKWLTRGYSIARFGDGELKIALGRSAKSQPFRPALGKTLRNMLANPHENPKCLVAIPNIGNLKTPKAEFWREYRNGLYTKLYHPAYRFGSSFITRPDSSPNELGEDHWNAVESLWAGKDVVLVRGSGKSWTATEMHKAASVHEIMVNRQDAYEHYDAIYEDLRQEKRPVILCCGATATALAWDLSKRGVKALDLGHAGMFHRKFNNGQEMVVTQEDKHG